MSDQVQVRRDDLAALLDGAYDNDDAWLTACRRLRQAIATEPPVRWWRYAVIRGPMIPARLDGVWFDLDDMPTTSSIEDEAGAELTATDRWEQRDDGAVAVVYEWTAGRG